MANLNKVMLIGRLTRDPEWIVSRTGERLGVKFGLAVNNRKFNQDTQRWEDVPVFLDLELWNRGENKQADRASQTLRGPNREQGLKASQVFIEGHLRMDEWTDKDTQKKRSKVVVVVDGFQYLDPRSSDGDPGEGTLPTVRAASRPPQGRQPAPLSRRLDEDDEDVRPVSRVSQADSEDDIPF